MTDTAQRVSRAAALLAEQDIAAALETLTAATAGCLWSRPDRF